MINLIFDCLLYIAYTCEPGHYVDVTSKTLECKVCSKGTYSVGGGVRFNNWDTVPTGFESRTSDAHYQGYGYDSEYFQEEKSGNCSKWVFLEGSIPIGCSKCFFSMIFISCIATSINGKMNIFLFILFSIITPPPPPPRFTGISSKLLVWEMIQWLRFVLLLGCVYTQSYLTLMFIIIRTGWAPHGDSISSPGDECTSELSYAVTVLHWFTLIYVWRAVSITNLYLLLGWFLFSKQAVTKCRGERWC